MSESTGFDLEAFISGGSRPERTTTVYANNALFADLEEARRLLAEHEKSVRYDETSLGGGSNDATADELEERIAALVEKLEQSQCVVRVQSLDTEDLEVIQDAAEGAVKDEGDKAAAKARIQANIYCKREGITTPRDVNERVKATAQNAYQRVFQRENTARVLAEAIVSPAMNLDTTRRFLTTIGEAQTAQIWAKFIEARTSVPTVDVPK